MPVCTAIWGSSTRFSRSFSTPTPKSVDLLSESGSNLKILSKENLILLSKGGKVLEIAVGAVFHRTRFSLVRISIRDLGPDSNPC